MTTPILTLVFDRKKQASRTKTGVVELRISQNKLRKYVSTGVHLYPKEWSNGVVVGRKDWKELNDQLQVILRKCREVVTKMMDDGSLDLNALPSALKAAMMQQKTFIDYAQEIAERRYRKVAPGTKRHYELVIEFLKSWKGIRYFADVTEKAILKMDDVLAAKGLKEQSRWNYHKLVKLFIRQAVEDGLIKKNPYARLSFRRGDEEGLTRYLTPDEFHKFEKCKITLAHLARVRDLWVFQAYTLMGYSDLAKFDYANCIEINGQMVYRSVRVKTEQPFTVVLLKPALAILKRYNYQLPIISNVKYNAYLKLAVMCAGIEKPVTTHWARHTGATLLLNDGMVPMHVVQHILGHATIRETEKTYAKVLDDTIVKAMGNYEKRIGR